MAGIAVQGSNSGSGSVTLLAPETNLAITVNVAAENGTVSPLVIRTPVLATGTNIDFTDIPNWVKRITLTLFGLSVAGTSSPLVRLSSNGIFKTSGYISTSDSMGSGVAPHSDTTGFALIDTTSSITEAWYATYIFTLVGDNKWVGVFTGAGTSPSVQLGGGGITLDGTLDAIRLTTISGTNTFDAGTVNIMYE